MRERGLKFYAQSQIWIDGIAVGIGMFGDGGKTSAVARLDFVPYDRYAADAPADPTMRLSHDEARDLMDALWGAGVRPSNGEGNTGQLGATQKHLEDMRTLVFKGRTE